MKMINPKHENNLTKTAVASVCLASCRKLIARIEKVKDSVVAEFRGALETHGQLLQLALSEAEALAWETGYPQIIFPTLAMEKAQAVAAGRDGEQPMQRFAV